MILFPGAVTLFCKVSHLLAAVEQLFPVAGFFELLLGNPESRAEK